MQNRELQVLTASDPLSLEEEYEQQKNWLEGSDRVTFILLEKSRLPTIGAPVPVSIPAAESPTSHTLVAVQGRSVCDAEVEAMIGDVNFYRIPDSGSERDDAFEGEVSVMIAEASSRGRGLAIQALAGVLLYVEHFFRRSVTAIVAKVSLDNEPSLRFFKNKLGFVERRRNACFNEVELVCPKSETEGSAVMQAASRAIETLKISGRDWLFRVYPISDFRSSLFSPEKA
ncbi:N-acetyltransferase 9-like protein [Taenia crassiceps]|uniref:N-acetyltransferase 9-like protein n=1 Tax=Taenia crassiceps TaxID=6207 RepID=A0ABR4QLS6_9CEST